MTKTPTEESINFINKLSKKPIEKEKLLAKGSMYFAITSTDNTWKITLTVQPGNYNMSGTVPQGLPCDWRINLFEQKLGRGGVLKNIISDSEYNKYGLMPYNIDQKQKLGFTIDDKALENFKEILTNFATHLNVEWNYKSILATNMFLQRSTGVRAVDAYNWLTGENIKSKFKAAPQKA